VYLAGDFNVFDKSKDIIKEKLPNCKIVKNEYLDWIITNVELGKEKSESEILFL